MKINFLSFGWEHINDKLALDWSRRKRIALARQNMGPLYLFFCETQLQTQTPTYTSAHSPLWTHAHTLLLWASPKNRSNEIQNNPLRRKSLQLVLNSSRVNSWAGVLPVRAVPIILRAFGRIRHKPFKLIFYMIAKLHSNITCSVYLVHIKDTITIMIISNKTIMLQWFIKKLSLCIFWFKIFKNSIKYTVQNFYLRCYT
jgi:hypothetical protein